MKLTSASGGLSGPLGDMAERVAQRFDAQALASLADAEPPADPIAETPLLAKIRFSWRTEDRLVLERIRAAADAMFAEAFVGLIEETDRFYAQLRVPEVRNGAPVIDAHGRGVWRTGEDGQPLEDWGQLTGQDVEYTLARLHRLKMEVAPRVNELMLEALHARNVASDTYDDAWGSLMEGTQGDRTARANRDSRVDRYHAYFRFYLYSVSKTFLDEVSSFIRYLENVRYRQVRSQ